MQKSINYILKSRNIWIREETQKINQKDNKKLSIKGSISVIKGEREMEEESKLMHLIAKFKLWTLILLFMKAKFNGYRLEDIREVKGDKAIINLQKIGSIIKTIG